MAFEERYDLLLSRVHEEYNSMVRNSNFMDGDVEKLAENITVAKALLTAIELPTFAQAPSDVETLLFYENPLTAACEWFRENAVSLWKGLSLPFDGFLRDTRSHIAEILEQWNALPMDEMARAEDYQAMEQKIEAYQQENEGRILQRECWQEEYHENLERDFSSCQEYLRRYEEIHNTPNSELERVMTALYYRMLEFDDFTDNQLHAISKMSEPITAVYRCLACVIGKNGTEKEILDQAILETANAQMKIMCHTQKAMEQDDELER